MILVIDNYDSFTYNLVQMIGGMIPDVKTVRNDQITLEEIDRLQPRTIVISPGPGFPVEAGRTPEIIQRFSRHIPTFGVCLGLQAIGDGFGGRIVSAPRLVHGKSTPVRHDGKTVFQGMGSPFDGGRYHSLMVERMSLPDCLEISAECDSGEIMALRHRNYPIEGVQFHPESILTPTGNQILLNFFETYLS